MDFLKNLSISEFKQAEELQYRREELFQINFPFSFSKLTGYGSADLLSEGYGLLAYFMQRFKRRFHQVFKFRSGDRRKLCQWIYTEETEELFNIK